MKELRNEIYCGDCLKLMRQMPANSVDLIVTSPPYNLLCSSGNGMKGKGYKCWPNPKLLGGYAGGYMDDMPYHLYVKWQRKCLRAMLRLIPDNGAIFYNHMWRVQKDLEQNRYEIIKGFPVRQTIIWDRRGGVNFNPHYFLPTHEVIYLICKPEFRLTAGKDPQHPRAACAMGTVWSFKPESGKNSHAAPFPVELARRCIASTDAKIVLDPFMGSGTTAVAARELGRDWIGIGSSAEYCEMARKRIAAMGLLDCKTDDCPGTVAGMASSAFTG
jgi:site-specific DNA-methyltransferase (adenine-specific)